MPPASLPLPVAVHNPMPDDIPRTCRVLVPLKPTFRHLSQGSGSRKKTPSAQPQPEDSPKSRSMRLMLMRFLVCSLPYDSTDKRRRMTITAPTTKGRKRYSHGNGIVDNTAMAKDNDCENSRNSAILIYVGYMHTYVHLDVLDVWMCRQCIQDICMHLWS
ncbi:uncharacterized protein LOC121404639 [Drosophila obscura]|uniref:uncharacterized protein LOC121404639 n=1 Tax=Drosophila obscura TaxID=7282 RepID=UPI001BB20875|nr:uncharacterized protein LOC121404639 [Drosophila obscura]